MLSLRSQLIFESFHGLATFPSRCPSPHSSVVCASTTPESAKSPASPPPPLRLLYPHTERIRRFFFLSPPIAAVMLAFSSALLSFHRPGFCRLFLPALRRILFCETFPQIELVPGIGSLPFLFRSQTPFPARLLVGSLLLLESKKS